MLLTIGDLPLPLVVSVAWPACVCPSVSLWIQTDAACFLLTMYLCLCIVSAEVWTSSIAAGSNARRVTATSRADSGLWVPTPRLTAQAPRLTHGETASDGERKSGNVHCDGATRSETQACYCHQAAAQKPQG